MPRPKNVREIIQQIVKQANDTYTKSHGIEVTSGYIGNYNSRYCDNTSHGFFFKDTRTGQRLPSITPWTTQYINAEWTPELHNEVTAKFWRHFGLNVLPQITEYS